MQYEQIQAQKNIFRNNMYSYKFTDGADTSENAINISSSFTSFKKYTIVNFYGVRKIYY